MRPAAPLIAAWTLAGLASCARISAEATSLVQPIPDAEPLATASRPAHTQLEVHWTQQGRLLTVQLRELHTCRATSLVPARREDRIVRRPDAMIYWEYGAAALGLGLALAAFARPEAFSTLRRNNELGLYERDSKTGYRLGGVFTAIGSGFLIGALVDTLRSRDQQRVTTTTLSREGPLQPCATPSIPASQRPLDLSIGATLLSGTTSDEGQVHFTLAPELFVGAGPSTSLSADLHVGRDVVPIPLLPLDSSSASGTVLAPPH